MLLLTAASTTVQLSSKFLSPIFIASQTPRPGKKCRATGSRRHRASCCGGKKSWSSPPATQQHLLATNTHSLKFMAFSTIRHGPFDMPETGAQTCSNSSSHYTSDVGLGSTFSAALAVANLVVSPPEMMAHRSSSHSRRRNHQKKQIITTEKGMRWAGSGWFWLFGSFPCVWLVVQWYVVITGRKCRKRGRGFARIGIFLVVELEDRERNEQTTLSLSKY